MRRPPARPRRGGICEACSDRLNGQGAILLDGTRKLYLCRACLEDAWARRDAADEAQRQILEFAWQLPSHAMGDGGEDAAP
jgi:hypothetical protein